MSSLKDANVGGLKFTVSSRSIVIKRDGCAVLSIHTALDLPCDSRPITCQLSDDSAHYDWPGKATLSIKKRKPNKFEEKVWKLSCYDIKWTPQTRDFVPSDAISLENGYWYGGAEMFEQRWPINAQHQCMMPYVTSDFFQGRDSCGDLLERLWVSSRGVGLHVPDHVPLHVSFNARDSAHEQGDQRLVLKADYSQSEYKNLGDQLPSLEYTVCVSEDVKRLWIAMQQEFYARPAGVPDERMFRAPVWSTWARYKVDVTQDKVLQYAREILQHGFPHSHIEIDDMFTTKYGECDFDERKFPDARAMVAELRRMGFRVTCWMHPFANCDAPAFHEGLRHGYWVKDARRKNAALTTWWQGVGATIDPTNAEAKDWFVSRLQAFKDKYDIDSFKFDAGEANWLPAGFSTNEELDNPCHYTTRYVNMVAEFGPMVEVRTGFQSQKEAIFVRMMDKHSCWGYENGLRSMVPTALLMSLLGYPFILPDMIGGNAYADEAEVEANPEVWAHTTKMPEKELLIRWTQLSAYLPCMQFSLAPWQYDEETVRACRLAVTAHEQVVTPHVLHAAQEAALIGTPIIRPLWWHDPLDDEALRCDSQYLVGSLLLVAPVLHAHARSRHVYLPRGTWVDQLRGGHETGPKWLHDYAVALDEVAAFLLVQEEGTL